MGFLDSIFGGGGGEGGEVPTLGGQVDEWLDQLPKLMDASQEYAPQQAELQFGLTSEYAPQYAELQKSILSQIFPETYGLQEQMAGQVSEGLSGDLTNSERRQFMDLQKSLVGQQATSGIGTDYIGSNLLNYIQGRKSQNQALGLNLLSNLSGVQSNYQPGYTDFLNTNQSSLLNQSLAYPAYQAQFQQGDSGGFDFMGALSGAGTGAAVGSMFGPVGTVVGAGIGGLGGGFA